MSTSHYHHFDAIGSTRLLTNTSQAITDTYIYRAFGDLATSSGSTPNHFRWIGRVGYFSDGDAPVYVRARCYSPATGRWMSVDPINTALDLNPA